MDLELVEKFIQALSAPESKIPIHNVMAAARIDPQKIVLQGLQYVNRYIKSADAEGHAACINGVLFGVTLALGVDKSPELVKLMKDYLEQKRLERGENIVDFAEMRAGRKK